MFGLTIGSFLNVVIHRLPRMLFTNWRNECEQFLRENNESPLFIDKTNGNYNLAVPRSSCPSCNAAIKAWQNIPVLSYLLLGGKCGNCKTTISLRYPVVEIITGLMSGVVVYQLGFTQGAGLALLLTWSLIVLTLIDADHQLLPDNITLPLLWLGLAANSFGVFIDLQSAVIGAIAGYLSLWSVYWMFKLLTGKEGMGFGDFKLLAALGAWMGWQQLPLIIILSSLVGAIYGIAAIIFAGKDKSKPIPFGPYLAVAGWIAFFWGDTINQLYLSSLG